ncbi:MAG: dihydropteroate synthase [Robiginitomaculum sp.]|nr:MAG: dihydropteroate synthase [Robiginitomaculum sp.]
METGFWQNVRSTQNRPLVCGILNVTPDSFSDGGQYRSAPRAIEHGLQLAAQGADLLDIGGESARPGADPVPIEAELERVLPVIEGISQQSSIPISIDTMKPEMARAALAAGAKVWNDVSALAFDPNSAAMAAELDCPLILMHMQGAPKTMQKNPTYGDVLAEVIVFLQSRIELALQAGVKRCNIMVDPGIGFGKKLADNLALLANLDRLAEQTGCPVLLGASRKRFIADLDPQASADQRLGGSLASIAAAFAQKVALVRVHDVAETVQMLRVLEAIEHGKT